MAHLIEVQELVTEFKQEEGTLRAVNGVSYYVDEGEVIAFVGESGSGKSVTQYSGLQLIPTARITGGEVLFNGKNILSFHPSSQAMRSVRGGSVGLIFQEPMTSLNPVMSIGHQLTEGMVLHLGMTRKAATARAVELLSRVGIPDPELRIKDYPHQFSGGMRQRIMIAMALACNPKVLIADEATTALDVTTQAQVLELMHELVRENNMALILITHNLSVVAQYAKRVYVMYAGKIVESARIDDLFYRPRHPYTIGLLNAVPGLNDPKDRRLQPIDGVVVSMIHYPRECAFYNRCPYATPECKEKPAPPLHSVPEEPEHSVACHRSIARDTPATVRQEDARRQRAVKQLSRDGEPLLSVCNLKVYFPVLRGFSRHKIADVKAVDGINFKIWRGETFGLVGESGCGKSTVARTLMRLTQPTGGQILFDGTDITHLDTRALLPVHRKMSMVFQDPFGSLDPRWRAADIVSEPLRNSGIRLSRAQIDKRIDELFALVGLDVSYRERVPHEFSGGQRQRLAIARALSTNPEFIVCDEAISSLDVSIQAQIINLLEELQQRLQLTYLFIAHDMSMVRHISDRVAVMYLGQLVEVGDWQSLFDSPMHPYTRALLEAVPVPDPAAERLRKKAIISGEVPSPMQRPDGCAFSSRCPYATDECRARIPKLHTVSDIHQVACHLIQS